MKICLSSVHPQRMGTVSFLSALCFFGLYCVGLTSCKEVRTITSVDRYKDSIPLQTGFQESSLKFTTIDGESFVSSYNRYGHFLSIYGLTSKKAESIRLPSFQKSSPLESYVVYTRDSILLLTNEEIFIINKASEIKYYWHFDTLSAYTNQPSAIIINDFNGFADILKGSNDHSILYRQYSMEYDWFDTNFYKTPVEAELDLEERKIRSRTLTDPTLYGKASFGQIHNVYRAPTSDGKVVYSFMGHPHLFITDTKTQKLELEECKSSFHHKDLSAFDKSKKKDLNLVVEHLVQNPEYLKILHDPYKNLHYRLFWKAKVDSKNSETTNTGIQDKETVLMVLDDDFNIIKEIDLGRGYGWFYSYVTPQGLYLKKFSTQKEYYIFEVFDIQ